LEAVRRKVPEIAREDKLSTSQQENLVYPEDVPSPERPLSSPLLCPRRTFLASLILASKFLQDRCYSNRAWAKLSGLSPREIGRCEKALGDALEWRLWVGKGAGKSLVRSRSEHDILALSAAGTARGTAGRMLGRARTVPCIGSDSQALSPSPISMTTPQPQLDPYQEWLVVNQDRLLQEDLDESSNVFSNNVDYTPMQCNLGLDSMPTPPTPGLTMSPTSTICSSASVSSFDSDEGERTIQICDIAEPFSTKLSGGCGWHINESKNDADIGLFDISAPGIVRLDSVGNQAWY
jgi:PHO85 cyclin-5